LRTEEEFNELYDEYELLHTSYEAVIESHEVLEEQLKISRGEFEVFAQHTMKASKYHFDASDNSFNRFLKHLNKLNSDVTRLQRIISKRGP
jgi:hypothetical protein